MCQHKLGMSERAACRVTGKPAAPNNEHPDVNGPMILIGGCVTGSTNGPAPKATLGRDTAVRGSTCDTKKAS